MQVWQLFHIIPHYCDHTKEDANVYCNMIKFLLKTKRIHGEQSIDSLAAIPKHQWMSLFHGSIFSICHVERFRAVIHNVTDYVSTHAIESVLTPPDEVTSPSATPMHTNNTHIGTIAMGVFTGFVVGCLCTWHIKK